MTCKGQVQKLEVFLPCGRKWTEAEADAQRIIERTPFINTTYGWILALWPESRQQFTQKLQLALLKMTRGSAIELSAGTNPERETHHPRVRAVGWRPPANAEPHVCYHGTKPGHLLSILNNGFRSFEGALGYGVHLSENLFTALSYPRDPKQVFFGYSCASSGECNT